jgi:DNA-binding XRE family transcriptional regulator
MSFKANSKIDEFIKKYQKEVSKKENKDITIEEVMKEIGDFADVSWTSIKQIKDRNMQPSIAVALRISEFFNTTINEIWFTEKVNNVIKKELKQTKKKITVAKEKPICKEEGCKNKSLARGLCNKHYQQYRNYHLNEVKTDNPITCTIEGCNNFYHAKGMCTFHYNKDYRENRRGKGI